MLWLSLLVVGCGQSSAAAPTATTSPPTATPEPEPFRIIGYVTDLDAVVSQIQFDKVTHLNYAFLIPKPDGTVHNIANGWKLEEVVTLAHENDVRVLISVGGWGYDDVFEEIAAAPQTRTTFVNTLNSFMQEYNLDGIDMDWEYPGPDPASAQNYVALMQELAAVLRPQHKLLTAAVVALGSNGEGIRPEVFGMVDFLNVMAYDGSDTNHSSYEYAVASLAYWEERGLPAEKMVLGVPFYARPNYVTYRKLVEANPEAAHQDSATYFGAEVYYNGRPTMQRKTELALQQASGIMIWTLMQDTSDSTSLLATIYSTVHEPE